MMELYICDRARKIADGKCNGIGCAMNDCTMTKDKEYAKEHISVFEAESLFKAMTETYCLNGNMEKAKQYANALKSVQEIIEELKDKVEQKDSVFADYLYEQLNLFKEML